MNEKKGQELMEDLAGGMPCSKRETVENMLEQLCRWRKNSSPLSSSRLCEKFQLSRRECSYYLKKMLECGYIFPLENTDEIRLTSFGIARGEELGYCHETFKQFLQLAGKAGRCGRRCLSDGTCGRGEDGGSHLSVYKQRRTQRAGSPPFGSSLPV